METSKQVHGGIQICKGPNILTSLRSTSWELNCEFIREVSLRNISTEAYEREETVFNRCKSHLRINFNLLRDIGI